MPKKRTDLVHVRRDPSRGTGYHLILRLCRLNFADVILWVNGEPVPLQPGEVVTCLECIVNKPR